MLWAGRARAYSEQKDWKKAEQDLSDALNGLPPDKETWRSSDLRRARADARRRQGTSKLAEAIDDYSLVLKANSDDGLAHAHLAEALVLSKLLQRAVEEYGEALRINKQNPYLLLKRA